MADEFDWHTDVDTDWEPPAPEPDQISRPSNRRPPWLLLVLAACLLLAAVFGVYRTLTDQVEEATSTAATGLSLAHELLVSGALSGDQDVVMSLVAERPASWRDLVADLASRRLLFSRQPLGLEVVPDADQGRLAEDDIRLTPELDFAEIVDRRPYVATGRGLSETVVLERFFFYQRAGEQWQLSPLADESAFWGNWITDERANVTLTYPVRDEAVAIKLSTYLDSFLPDLCAAADMACPEDFHLTFKLERDPTSIRRLSEGVYAVRTGSGTTRDRLVLPAPSLVGSPVDDAGYRALQRGYASWIGSAIAARYGAADIKPAEVLAQFDLQVPPAPARPLPRPAAANFPAGTGRPGQDVLLLCNENSAEWLLRFDTGRGVWREEATGELWGQADGPGSYLSRLPDYRGVIVQTSVDEGEQTVWQSYLVRDGSAQLLTEERQMHYYLPPRLWPFGQPSNGRLAYFVPEDEAGAGYSALMVDLDTCDSSPCETRSLPGMPEWSPSGQRTVLIAPDTDGGQMLYLGDEMAEIVAPVGLGQSPIWLDEDRFVYVARLAKDNQDRLGRWFGQAALQVDASGGSSPDVSPFLDAEMVRQAMPAARRPENLAIWSVQPAMPEGDWWYVTARGERDGKRLEYVLVYDRAANEVRLVIPMEDYGLVQAPIVNATGQQAVVISMPRDGSRMRVELIDAGAGAIRPLPPLLPQDWSAGGDWLIQLDRGVLNLVSTTNDAQWSIEHDLVACYWAVWTQQDKE